MTAVSWLQQKIKETYNKEGKLPLGYVLNLISQAKAMEKEQRELIYKRGYVDGIGDTQLVNSTIKNKL